jgi:hypothetical protein
MRACRVEVFAPDLLADLRALYDACLAALSRDHAPIVVDVELRERLARVIIAWPAATVQEEVSTQYCNAIAPSALWKLLRLGRGAVLDRPSCLIGPQPLLLCRRITIGPFDLTESTE